MRPGSIYVYVVHYSDFIMGTMASHITSLTIVYSTVYSDADQRKQQSSVSLANNAEMFPFDDVITYVTDTKAYRWDIPAEIWFTGSC